MNRARFHGMSNQLETLVAKAKELSAEQNFDACAEVFAEIFRHEPDSPAGIAALSEVMVNIGQVDAGLALLADSVDPATPDPVTLRTIANLLRGQDRLDEAADFLFCALAQSPGDQELFEETRALFTSLNRVKDFEEGFESSHEEASSGTNPSGNE